MDKLEDGTVSFFKLPTGSFFIFCDPKHIGPTYNGRYGPFAKIARGTYRCIDGTIMPHTDGTIRVLVTDKNGKRIEKQNGHSVQVGAAPQQDGTSELPTGTH